MSSSCNPHCDCWLDWVISEMGPIAGRSNLWLASWRETHYRSTVIYPAAWLPAKQRHLPLLSDETARFDGFGWKCTLIKGFLIQADLISWFMFCHVKKFTSAYRPSDSTDSASNPAQLMKDWFRSGFLSCYWYLAKRTRLLHRVMRRHMSVMASLITVCSAASSGW